MLFSLTLINENGNPYMLHLKWTKFDTKGIGNVK